ncbi:MAG: oligosaccharide flippase family protein [Clostridia bacterium]|nr:oligosaccharide flippase family protein [Clostridia bacterium]
MITVKQAFQKYHAMEAPAKASIWYTLCSILQKGISFIVVPLYSRMLTTTEYGKYVVFQSWRDILIILATLNLYCGVFTKAMVDYPDDRDRYTSSMQGLSTLITIGLFLVYLVRPSFWSSLVKMDLPTMLLLFSYYLFYPAFSFWSVRQRVEYRYKKMVLATLLVSMLTPAVSIMLLRHTDLRENAVIWGFLAIQGLVGAGFYVYHFIKCPCFVDKKYWLHGLKFNIPLIPHYLSLIVLGQADRIMIDSMDGTDKSAIYGLAYQISMVMNIFIGAINGSLVPWVYSKLKEKDYHPIAKIGNQLCVLIGVMSVGVILIAPEFVGIMGPPDYYAAIWIIPSVALSVYFTFCYSLFSDIEFYYGATKYVMVASTVGAVSNIILNAIFIPLFGFIAAGYTTLACYALFMVMHYFFMRSVCRKNINGTRVFDERFIILSCLALLAIIPACLLLYRYTLVRYGSIVLILAVAFLFRKKILSMVQLIQRKE